MMMTGDHTPCTACTCHEKWSGLCCAVVHRSLLELVEQINDGKYPGKSLVSDCLLLGLTSQPEDSCTATLAGLSSSSCIFSPCFGFAAPCTVVRACALPCWSHPAGVHHSHLSLTNSQQIDISNTLSILLVTDEDASLVEALGTTRSLHVNGPTGITGLSR
jgi:hypothetical protein